MNERGADKVMRHTELLSIYKNDDEHFWRPELRTLPDEPLPPLPTLASLPNPSSVSVSAASGTRVFRN